MIVLGIISITIGIISIVMYFFLRRYKNNVEPASKIHMHIGNAKMIIGGIALIIIGIIMLTR
jgi:hypothetical protein